MAYAVLHSLSQAIDQFLNHNEYPIPVGLKQHLASTGKQAIFLRKFIVDFPQESSSLETRIRDAANDGEDVLEHFIYEHIRTHHKSVRLAEVGRPTSADIHYDLAELEMVMDEINSVAAEAAAIQSEIAPVRRRPPTQPEPTPAPAPPTVETVTVGIQEDLQKIIDSVCADSAERRIIPITGMGGIGKTTLARKVYDDELVMATFQVRAWVTVTHDHKPDNIFADLLYNLPDKVKEGHAESSDSNVDKLYKILTLRKYLIVVDDLWSDKAWDDIRRAFGDSRSLKGSRIVITTRNESVASSVSTSSPHQMQLLKPEDSWSLLELKAFPVAKQCPPLLEKIGRDISMNCGGLPLAIVLVGGILSNIGQTEESWEKIAKDVHAAVGEAGDFEKIISLSYTHLPIRLRPCFLYIGSFPRDREIRLSKLIKLWIAEGMVEHEKDAWDYLNNLMSRSLAMVTAIKSNGNVKSCNVHDLVCDLCKRNILEENYERRLSIAHPDLMQVARAYASTLRSVVSFQPNEGSLGRLRKFKLLRVLDVVDTIAYSLPAPVFQLFHLRYLAFGCPMEVPAAISRLQNLHTLIIRPSKRLRNFSKDEVYLPLEIWMMPLLKHLVSFFDLLPNPEATDSPNLQNLLTLSVVKKLICTEEMMKSIPKLQKLAITYFGDKYQEDYQLNNLVFLHQLEKLTLAVENGSLVQLDAKPIFPENLRKLTLSGWHFPWEDLEAVACLPNLQVLKLRNNACEGDSWETRDSDNELFPKLEHLLIDGCDLENWETEKDHFPKLKRLVLQRCDKLGEIPDDIGHISTLVLIEVDRANTPLLECVKQIQKEQREEYDNKLLQVRAL